MSAVHTDPVLRLALSRERLRQALHGAPSADSAQVSPAAASWWSAAMPVAGIAIEAAQQWWARHPLRPSTLLALSAAQAIVKPLAQRHPLALVCGAAVVGGLLVWQRRWALRFTLSSTLWAGLLPHLLLATLAARADVKASTPTPERTTP